MMVMGLPADGIGAAVTNTELRHVPLPRQLP